MLFTEVAWEYSTCEPTSVSSQQRKLSLGIPTPWPWPPDKTIKKSGGMDPYLYWKKMYVTCVPFSGSSCYPVSRDILIVKVMYGRPSSVMECSIPENILR